ncbi:hypothetical protein HXA31_17840 [Salipaludibacillus agaradhaerens]|uniref:Uncharacterized protein n=1 Tax=Salipaludibacillus agaradhaerens TaxID=76935 RepID=A0A9Q4B539_SALAG|nr:hypothetical protein [Salipaludibacillus agaradhaerens]MCR6098172.1 hypothetical protein [Salipaludibacillus agaradhaerens]MCR6116198.1 hypothetical protein [Salipaludibacillus agaradhaerens]
MGDATGVDFSEAILNEAKETAYFQYLQKLLHYLARISLPNFVLVSTALP